MTLPTPSIPRPRQLPPGMRDFTGRAEELAALNTALRPSDTDSGAVAVVEGMGGIGKTSLVTRWAQQATDRS